MSEPVTAPVADPAHEFVTHITSRGLPAAGNGELRHVGRGGSLADDPVVVTELVAAATRQVFAPDPLADPAGVLAAPTSAPDPVAVAAACAGVTLRAVDTHLDVAAAVGVLDAVFAPAAGAHFYPPSLLRNLLAAGAPVLLAWDGATPVGVVLALPAWTADGRPLLQSGPMAVLPAARGRGVSVALKLAQRAWAAERGLTQIRWSFDAMVAVNAQLNLSRLGATVEAFLPGYEGIRHATDPTSLPYDRLLVAWHLADTDAAPEMGSVEPMWAVAAGDDGLPVLDPSWGCWAAARVAVPADVSTLRRDAPAAASAWQHAVGQVLREAIGVGWRVGWEPQGGYRLTAPGRRTTVAGVDDPGTRKNRSAVSERAIAGPSGDARAGVPRRDPFRFIDCSLARP